MIVAGVGIVCVTVCSCVVYLPMLFYLPMLLLKLFHLRALSCNFIRAQELVERERKPKETGREKNLKMMVWQCKSCLLSGNPDSMKPQKDFGVRNESDFVTRLLPQGSWARCTSCSHKLQHQFGKDGGDNNNVSRARRRKFGELGGELGSELGGDRNNISKEERKEFGKLGGDKNNAVNEDRRLAAAQACNECSLCHRMLPRTKFWLYDWRHRTSKAIACSECRPAKPNERPRGGGAANQQRAAKASGSPITCKICQRALPRSDFRPAANGKFQIYKGLTCEQCRGEGKLNKGGRK